MKPVRRGQLALFDLTPPAQSRKYGPCRNPWQPGLLADPHPDDADDAIGLEGMAYCCAIHYVRHLRYKFELDV